MKIRLGYVSISNALQLTTSSTITYSNYLKIYDKEEKIDKIIKLNLYALNEIIKYNIKNNIHFYRLTSKLIPLATHENVNFDYIKKYKNEFNKIGKKIKESNMRVDVHPDQFCVINSTKKDVVDRSFKILEYHYNILQLLGIKNKVIILHMGSNEFGKNNSIKRFINNFNKLPEEIKNCIALENDDKVFNIDDVLYVCEILNIKPIFDVHHHNCNKGKYDIKIYLDKICKLWKGDIPKMHFSSPKNNTKKEFRSHNDYINSNDFINFTESLKYYNKDVDIMIEAKKKDDSLFRLIRELKYKTNYNFIDETTFHI